MLFPDNVLPNRGYSPAATPDVQAAVQEPPPVTGIDIPSRPDWRGWGSQHTCWTCKERGHQAKVCPQRPSIFATRRSASPTPRNRRSRQPEYMVVYKTHLDYLTRRYQESKTALDAASIAYQLWKRQLDQFRAAGPTPLRFDIDDNTARWQWD